MDGEWRFLGRVLDRVRRFSARVKRELIKQSVAQLGVLLVGASVLRALFEDVDSTEFWLIVMVVLVGMSSIAFGSTGGKDD